MGSGGQGAVSLRIRINPMKNHDPMAAIVLTLLNASNPSNAKDKITTMSTILPRGDESELTNFSILYPFENVLLKKKIKEIAKVQHC